MTPRGLGTRCPPSVAELLRLYGWAGASGWWSHPEESDRAGAEAWFILAAAVELIEPTVEGQPS